MEKSRLSRSRGHSGSFLSTPFYFISYEAFSSNNANFEGRRSAFTLSGVAMYDIRGKDGKGTTTTFAEFRKNYAEFVYSVQSDTDARGASCRGGV